MPAMLARVAALICLLAAPALAQPDEGSLSRMLRAVPAPADIEPFKMAMPVFAYARLSAGPDAAGHALDMRASRYQTSRAVQPLAVRLAGLSSVLPLAEAWPAILGFEASSVDAVLVAPIAGSNPASPLRVLAGGPRLQDTVHIGDALGQRGFKRENLNGAALFSLGEDNQINPARRQRGDPFGSNVGLAQRIVVTPPGLLVSSSTRDVQVALDAWSSRVPSFADTGAMGGLLAALPDAEVVQAVVLSPLGGLELRDALPGADPADTSAIPDGPRMPPWAMAAIAELLSPVDAPRQRLVLALPDPAAARAILEARIRADRADRRPLQITGLDTWVLPGRYGGLGVLAADIQYPSDTPAISTPLYRWYEESSKGRPTPLTFRVFMLRPGSGRP